MDYRIEKDTMGEVRVASDKYWGAQTERSRNNFKIGPSGTMPLEVIYGFAYLKKAAAHANCDLGVLDEAKKDLISRVCDEILDGQHDDQFPLVIWQTGSGTQSNMNCNEVIANRAHVIAGKALGEGEKTLQPNDDVNKSQSSNDTFPTGMHIAAYKMVVENTIPGVEKLRTTFQQKSEEYKSVVKIGRTHLMDATPLTVGQEFSGYVSQLDHGLKALRSSPPGLPLPWTPCLPMRWWRSSFRPSRAIEMPGSPYLDQPPKGLLTWPKLLRLAGLPLAAFLGASWYYGVLFEALVIITVTMVVVNWLAR